MSDRREPPQLLVSVRSVDEARAALAGGADIIDIKEPGRGSLGCADAEVIQAVASLLGIGVDERIAARNSSDVPLLRTGTRGAPIVTRTACPAEAVPSEMGASFPAGQAVAQFQEIACLQRPGPHVTRFSVALGEVHETPCESVVALPPHVTFAKLGLAHLRDVSDWISRWVTVRRAFSARARTPPGWIGVIYADAEAAQAPPALEIIHAAAATGCVGVLVDTYGKSGGRLLDHVTPVELSNWAGMARTRRLLFAVAGRLAPEDLPHLAFVSADVIAVRSAVCAGRDRCAAISAVAVAEFKRAIQAIHLEVRAQAATAEVAACPPED